MGLGFTQDFTLLSEDFMPSDVNTAVDELELDIDADESGDDPENTDKDDSTEVDLSLVQKQMTPAEKSAQDQENRWYADIIAGKRSIEDLKAANLAWLVPRVEKRLGALEKTPDIEEIVTKKLQEQQEEAEFKKLQSSIPKLSKPSADALKREYVDMVKAGANRVTALKAALRLTGINSEKTESAPLPPVGKTSAKGKLDMDAVSKDEKLWKEFLKDPEAFKRKHGME